MRQETGCSHDVGYERPSLREGQRVSSGAEAFPLEERVGDCHPDDVPMPPVIHAHFELTETESVLQLGELLFDRLALVGLAHDRSQRGRDG